MKLYWNHRNGIFMLIKNLSSARLLPTLAKRFMLDAINVGYSALFRLDPKHSWAILRAYGWILTHLGFILKKRRETQQNALVNPQQVEGLFYPKSIIWQYFVKGRKTFSALQEALKP